VTAGHQRRWGLALVAGAITTCTCLALIHTTAVDAYWTGDCANRALVARRLHDTGFRTLAFDYPAQSLDPTGRAFPLPDLARPRGAERVSVFPVSYPALAAPLLGLGGDGALRWPAALGTGACALLFALWLTPVLGRRVAAAAGLAFGLATPLLFYGATVWEHSLALALVLGSIVALGSRDAKHVALAGVLGGLALWLREETALLLLAVILVEAGRARRLQRALLFAAAAAVPALGLAAFNAAVYGTPLGPHIEEALHPARLLPIEATEDAITRVAALVVARGHGPGEAVGLLAAASAAFGIGAAAEWRQRGRWPAMIIATAITLGIWALGFGRSVRGPTLLALVAHNGFVAQIPLVGLAGIGAVRAFRDPQWSKLRPGIASGLLFLALGTAFGLAMHRRFGMGLHIAPRKLLLALPALFALAVVAVHGRFGAVERRVATTCGALLLSAGLASSVFAGWLLHHQKTEGAALQRWIRDRPETILVSGDAMLTQLLTGIWYDKPMLYTADATTLRAVVGAMRTQGIARVLVLGATATGVRDASLGLACRLVARFDGETLGYWNTDILSCATNRGRRTAS